MAKETKRRGTGSMRERQSGSKTRNPHKERKQPIGGGRIQRKVEASGHVGGEGDLSQHANADSDGPSRQTSTAQDELGQG